MIKALLFIFQPCTAWERVVEARRSLGFLLVSYLFPMMLIAATAEGFGLVEWGKPQADTHRIHKFTTGEALIYELAQSLLTLLAILVCAWLIKMLGTTFHGRHTHQETRTLAIYGLSPMFLFRLLDAFPAINPWIPWAIGIALSIEVIYQGILLVLQPDMPSALGLFFMCALLVVTLTGLVRFLTASYLAGHIPVLENFTSQLAAKLPF